MMKPDNSDTSLADACKSGTLEIIVKETHTSIRVAEAASTMVKHTRISAQGVC